MALHTGIQTFCLFTFFYILHQAVGLSSGKPAEQFGDDLPTSYEYYTSGGINSGLNADKPYFTLNDRNITIYSGSMHYFRVPRAYWRDRLRKIRAAGLNTVETYIAWNLHEYESGKYDFGDGGSEMEDFLNITEFLKIAQEEDLFAIIRSGPFICSEFEFGGFPSWLLHGKQIEMFRTSDPVYVKYIQRYFNVLMPILAEYQFTKGGPIIAFQVENEYALMGDNADKEYLTQLRNFILDNGIVELLVTADNPWRGTVGTIPEYFLMAGNFDSDAKVNLDTLETIQPGRPRIAMEFWSGWFDYWGQEHDSNLNHTKTAKQFAELYEAIVSYPSSVNIYMFEGGTSFGFLNGAINLKYDDENTEYESITSSYDYGGVLSEPGDYTEKYTVVKDLIAKYNPIQTKVPEAPELVARVAYSNVTITEQISIEEFLSTVEPVFSSDLINMEELNIHGGSGQSYGYIVYRQENLNIDADAVLTISGRVCDTVMVLVNGELISPILEHSEDLEKFGTWAIKDSYITLSKQNLENATLDLIVENWGRVNVGAYKQYKGLWQGSAYLNEDVLKDWIIFPLEFKKSWTNSLENWKSVTFDTVGPSLYKGVLEIEDEPRDTFIYLENWVKGIVIVNGFVIGRYARMGPAQTLYLPGPFLNKGANDIVIFEHFKSAEEILFSTNHVYVKH